jgi:hypothetical protein
MPSRTTKAQRRDGPKPEREASCDLEERSEREDCDVGAHTSSKAATKSRVREGRSLRKDRPRQHRRPKSQCVAGKSPLVIVGSGTAIEAVQETAAQWAFNKRRFDLRSGLGISAFSALLSRARTTQDNFGRRTLQQPSPAGRELCIGEYVRLPDTLQSCP